MDRDDHATPLETDHHRLEARTDRRARSGITITIQLLVLCASFTMAARGQCTSVKPLGTERQNSVGGIADSIGLIFEDPALAPVAETAVRSWSRCRNYGTGFPVFRVGERGTRTVLVRYVRGSDGLSRTCGEFRGGTVTLFATTVGPRGRRLPCGSLENNLAHELGHFLGWLKGTRPIPRVSPPARVGGSSRASRSGSREEPEMVGARGFEPPASRSRTVRSTRLSYAP